MSKMKRAGGEKKQLYPVRAANTYIKKQVQGPDKFRQARAKNPGKYLTDAEMNAMRVKKKK